MNELPRPLARRRTWEHHGFGGPGFAPDISSMKKDEANSVFLKAFASGTLAYPCATCKHYTHNDSGGGWCSNIKARPVTTDALWKAATDFQDYIGNALGLGTALHYTPPEVPASIHSCGGYECCIKNAPEIYEHYRKEVAFQLQNAEPHRIAFGFSMKLKELDDIGRIMCGLKTCRNFAEWACMGLGRWLHLASSLVLPLFHSVGAFATNNRVRDGISRAFFDKFGRHSEKQHHTLPPDHIVHYFDKVCMFVRQSEFEKNWWGEAQPIKGKAPQFVWFDEVKEVDDTWLKAAMKSKSKKMFFTSTPPIKDNQ